MLRQRNLPIWFFLLLALAGIGLLSQLFTNIQSFASMIVMTVGTIVFLYGILYFLFFRNRRTNELKKYKKAVKQSKKRNNTKSMLHHFKTKQTSSSKKVSTRNRKSAPHLRVIDGKKSKRKDRATF